MTSSNSIFLSSLEVSNYRHCCIFWTSACLGKIYPSLKKVYSAHCLEKKAISAHTVNLSPCYYFCHWYLKVKKKNVITRWCQKSIQTQKTSFKLIYKSLQYSYFCLKDVDNDSAQTCNSPIRTRGVLWIWSHDFICISPIAFVYFNCSLILLSVY